MEFSEKPSTVEIPLSEKFLEAATFAEVVENIQSLPPGVLLVDSDNTLRPSLQAGASGRFGLVTEDNLALVDELQEKGWQVAVVSNQFVGKKGQGHQIARALSSRGGYSSFPQCFEDRGIPLFGGGLGFPVKHYKKTPKAVQEVGEWVLGVLAGQLDQQGPVVFVGDRRSDVEFAHKVQSSVAEHSEQPLDFLVYKLPGMEEHPSPFVRAVAKVTP